MMEKDKQDLRDFTVMEEEEDLRLDVFLSEQMQDLSRSYIQSLIKAEKALVEGRSQRPSYRVHEGERVTILVPPPKDLKIHPQNLPLDIVYEDEALAVVYKDRGMVVHPAPGNYENTLVNAILYHMKGKLSSINGVIRPGIVHRIDKDTSGLLMVAKTDAAHRALSEQFKEHSVTRRYTFLCCGELKQEYFTVEASIGRNPKDRLKMAVVANGKPAVTHIERICLYDGYSYASATLETGRTHQIRVHMAYRHHPLIGDRLYGNPSCVIKAEGQLLHAGLIGFVHPMTHCKMEFCYPEPRIFEEIKKKLKEKKS